MKNIADIRQEYTKSGLRESELPCDPLSLFSRWLQEAIDANVEEPTAIIVGTVSPEGRPSTRTVLLKGLHDGKFIFYTNYESRKGRQLAQNPYISLSFVWHELERQVHIEGTAAKVSPEESDEYFRKRPYKSLYSQYPDLYTSQERYFSPQGRTQLHLRFPSHQQDQSNLKCLQEEEGDNRLTP